MFGASEGVCQQGETLPGRNARPFGRAKLPGRSGGVRREPNEHPKERGADQRQALACVPATTDSQKAKMRTRRAGLCAAHLHLCKHAASQPTAHSQSVQWQRQETPGFSPISVEFRAASAFCARCGFCSSTRARKSRRPFRETQRSFAPCPCRVRRWRRPPRADRG